MCSPLIVSDEASLSGAIVLFNGTVVTYSRGHGRCSQQFGTYGRGQGNDADRRDRSNGRAATPGGIGRDRKSTRLNSSHVAISYAVFCLNKKTTSDDSRSSEEERNSD